MSESAFVVGIDPHPDEWRAVRMRLDGPRTEVSSVAMLSPGQAAPDGFFDEAEILLAVPGLLAVVKNITTPSASNGDSRDRALFELAQSLTGGEREYLLDVAPTGLDGLMLGMAVRRAVLQREILQPMAELTSRMPVRAMVRGMALAHGYLAYCRPSRGGLLVMVDQGDSFASVALIYRNRVVALAHLPTEHFDLTMASDRDRYAIELKTVVTFRLAALFDYGLTLPSSALVVSGEQVDEDLRGVLERYFAVPIDSPVVNAGFLGRAVREESAGMWKFLAAMGPAANLLA